MDQHEREHLTARVCSGTVRVRAAGKLYLVSAPTPSLLYAACEAHDEALAEALDSGAPTEQEILCMLLDDGLWDAEAESLYTKLPKEADDFKVGMFKAYFKSVEREALRKYLNTAREKLSELQGRRHAYDHLGANGLAAQARARLLVGCSLFTSSGGRVFGEDDFWERDCELLDEVLARLAESRLGEAQLREVARCDPFRGLYTAGKGSVFPGPSSTWTDEQKALAGWAGLYDNVSQHPDCPPDDVVADDDVMDGWLIDQRRKRDSRLEASRGEQAAGTQAGAQEVYLPADTQEDARKVMSLNKGMAAAVQKQRFDKLRKDGEVSETDMPDTKQKLRSEQMAAFRARATGR